MRVVKICEALGARIEGVDISQPLDNDTVEAIKQVWREHLVIVFPNQELTPEQQLGFSRYFGEIVEHPMTAHLPAPTEGLRAEHREMLPVTEGSRTNAWHTDITGLAVPPTFSILYGKKPLEMEGVDEDTHFSNQYRALEELSPGLRSFLEKRQAFHSLRRHGVTKGLQSNNKYGGNSAETKEEEDKSGLPDEEAHPCVRTHPETGRPLLYVNVNIDRFDGWTAEESTPLLNQLVTLATQEKNVYKHHWKKGDVVCWDNRCTMHKGPPSELFPPGAERFLIRTTVIPKEEVRPYYYGRSSMSESSSRL